MNAIACLAGGGGGTFFFFFSLFKKKSFWKFLLLFTFNAFFPSPDQLFKLVLIRC